MTEPFTLFYSWQSDILRRIGQDFIRGALEEAAALLESRGYALRIDSGTRDVPGMPSVIETILCKIEACDVFLGDITFVGERSGDKKAPNPNVLIEYGYAMRAKGQHRTLLVMNQAFGEPSGLPFDLTHLRFPPCYQAAADTPPVKLDEKRSRFARTLADQLELMLRAVAAERAAAGGRSTALDRAGEMIAQRSTQIGTGKCPALVMGPKLLLYLVPLATLDGRTFDKLQLGEFLPQFAVPSFSRAEVGSDGRQWWIVDPPHRKPGLTNPVSRWSMTVERPGLFEFVLNLGAKVEDDAEIGLDGRQLESWIVAMSERLGRFAAKLGFTGGAAIGATISGAEDLVLLPPRGPGLRLARPVLHLELQAVSDLKAPMATELKHLLDDLWITAGALGGSPSYSGGRWAGETDAEGYSLD